MKIAIIIPVYNEGSAIYNNFLEIQKQLNKDNIHPTFIFINDGSVDHTQLELERIHSAFSNTNSIEFTRNFGKEMAICAGIDYIKADRYIIMDSDLQHPPKDIKPMLDLMTESKVNIIEGVKSDRGHEKKYSRLLAKTFYHLLKTSTNLDMDNSSDFKIIDNEVADAVRKFSERNIFFRGVIDWVGFTKESYSFQVDDRKSGQTSFSIKSLIKLAFTAVFSYTSKPLYIPMLTGFIFLVLALILGIQTLANYFLGNAVSGFSTVIILLLIIGSIIMLSLGIIGLYIARIYDEIKGRPRYLIKKQPLEGEKITPNE